MDDQKCNEIVEKYLLYKSPIYYSRYIISLLISIFAYIYVTNKKMYNNPFINQILIPISVFLIVVILIDMIAKYLLSSDEKQRLRMLCKLWLNDPNTKKDPTNYDLFGIPILKMNLIENYTGVIEGFTESGYEDNETDLDKLASSVDSNVENDDINTEGTSHFFGGWGKHDSSSESENHTNGEDHNSIFGGIADSASDLLGSKQNSDEKYMKLEEQNEMLDEEILKLKDTQTKAGNFIRSSIERARIVNQEYNELKAENNRLKEEIDDEEIREKYMSYNNNSNQVYSITPIGDSLFNKRTPLSETAAELEKIERNKNKCLLGDDRCGALCSGYTTNPCNLVAPIPGPQWQPQSASTVQNRIVRGDFVPSRCPQGGQTLRVAPNCQNLPINSSQEPTNVRCMTQPTRNH